MSEYQAQYLERRFWFDAFFHKLGSERGLVFLPILKTPFGDFSNGKPLDGFFVSFLVERLVLDRLSPLDRANAEA